MYPEFLLIGISWSFIGNIYSDLEIFNQTIRERQIKIFGDNRWDPKKIILNCPRVVIQYLYWKQGEQIEPELYIESDNNQHFASDELMFKIHNKIVKELSNSDDYIFEGLVLDKESSKSLVPKYFLILGS